MAKQVVNPIERHIEKALLAVAGIALIGVIVMFVVRSPNQVEIGGEMVTPGEIDAKLAVAIEYKITLRPDEPVPCLPQFLLEDMLQKVLEAHARIKAKMPVGGIRPIGWMPDKRKLEVRVELIRGYEAELRVFRRGHMGQTQRPRLTATTFS